MLTDDWTVAKDFLTSLSHKDKGQLHKDQGLLHKDQGLLHKDQGFSHTSSDPDPALALDSGLDIAPPFQCVIKPCRGSASLGVFLASSIEEAERVFRASVGTYGNGYSPPPPLTHTHTHTHTIVHPRYYLPIMYLPSLLVSTPPFFLAR